jgi:hypothetical protein
VITWRESFFAFLLVWLCSSLGGFSAACGIQGVLEFGLLGEDLLLAAV